MAKGISNRMHLNLPMARRAMDPVGLESRLDDALRVIDRWANSLPFAVVGFHFRRTTNELATANLGATNITWNQVIEDREGWMPSSGSTSSIVVPRERSGLYLLRLSVLWQPAAAFIAPRIQVNGANAITSPDSYLTTIDRATVTTLALLGDGDVITAGITNNSGSPTTVTAFGGDIRSNPYPQIQGWRLALLG